MASPIKYDDIKDLKVSWENYAGQKVEEFIKKELGQSVGYLYRTPAKINDYYYLLAFQCYDDFEKWQTREDDSLVLFRVQLPNVENDVFSVHLETNTPQGKMVNLGEGIKVNLRYTSISENPVTHVITDTYNDGILHVLRAANGSAYEEVALLPITPTEYADLETYREVDLTPYLADGTNQIRLRVEDSANGTMSNNINFNEIINTQLVIENAMDLSKPLRSLAFDFYIQGQVQKTLNLRITGDDINDTFTTALGETTYIEVPYTFTIDRILQTGIKNVEAWLSVDGTALQSPHINLQVYYMDAAVDQSVVILNNVTTEITNYTNVHFLDFTVYNKRSDVTISIETNFATLLEYTFPDCQTETLYSFSNVLEVVSSQPMINATLRVRSEDYEVTQRLTIDNTVDFNPTSGYDFMLNPKNRDNNETNRDRIINDATNLVVPSTFTNFTWVQDGWQTGYDGIRCLRLVGGDTLEIEYDPLDNVVNGTTIELDFRVFNVFDSSDVIFRFCNYNEQNNPIGFEMTAQDACFMTNDKQVRRDQDVMYTEGNRTHMVINIIPNLSNSNLNYVRIFVNGCINREFIYANTDLFKYNDLPDTFIIGSEHCDIDLYNIRVYKKSVSASQIRQNYMSSLATAEEKVAFKTANDILAANETISYAKAKVKYNTMVWTGKVPSYTTGNVKFNGSLNVNILGDPEHSGDLTNLQISGQGSSSRGYWKWNHQYKFGKTSKFIDNNGTEHSDGYAITADDPAATKLVAKLNWASSMQSHKAGSTALYTDLWKAVIGGNSITRNANYSKCRVSVHELPFLYFVRETEYSTPVFYGLMTFGSAKADEPTFVGSYDAYPEYIMLEGSDNGMPLTLRQVPWIDDEVTYNEEEEYFEYADAGNLDFDGGNIDNYVIYRDAYTFTYLHSPFLVPFNGDLTALNNLVGANAANQYWNTSNGDVYRYDWRSQTWVNGGVTRTKDYLYHLTTQEDVDEGRADYVGELVVDQYPEYSVLNLVAQTGISLSGSAETLNIRFIEWRVQHFKDNIATYYNVNDTLYNMAFVKMIAASDNWCKNTYEYVDPRTMKICWLNDDLDTIFLTDNVGRKTKPYYVEEHDMNGDQAFFNGSDNVFFNLMEMAFKTEYRAMMRTMLNTMGTNEFGGSVANCMDRYFFSIQKYFPAVAYNETARLLYEEASVAQAQGRYTNGTPAISQSLGDQYQAELGFWRKREPYLQSWAAAVPFAVRSTGSLGFRSMLTTDSQRPSYSFQLTPYQWLYPKVGIGQTLGTDNQRVTALTEYNTISLTTDGNTDSFIYGADYYLNFGEFGGHSIGEAFNLSGARLLEFSADSRKVGSYQFRPTSMTVACPVLRKLSIYGCSTLRGVLDLSSSVKLTQVDCRGTGLSSVVFPRTETLTDIYIGDVVSLNITGVPNLTTFVTSGTSNLTSLTTDSPMVIEYYIERPNISGIQEIHLNNVNLDLTSQSTTVSDNLYTLLTRPNSTASGRVYLNKKLTLAEQQALQQKYGNIDNTSNQLYVEYIIETQNTLVITGDSEITQTKSKNYSVAYNGNDIRSYQWSVQNGSYQMINDYTVRVVADADNADDIIVTCTVTRLRNTDVVAIKTIDVIAYIPIREIDLGADVNYYRPGQYTIPVSYLPSRITVDILPEDIVASMTGVGTNVVINSADLQQIVLTTTEPAQDIHGTLKLRATDIDGNFAEDTININVWKTVAIGNVTGTGVNENTVNYGNLAPGDNDFSSSNIIQSAATTFTLSMTIPAGYSIGSVSSSNNKVIVSGNTENTITFTCTDVAAQTTNITIPLVNDVTGNIQNYVMQGVKVKRNIYIGTVSADTINWRVGDGTIRINYSVAPSNYNVAIDHVVCTADNDLSNYLTYQSQGDGYVTYSVTNTNIDNYVAGTIDVNVVDVNGHSHHGTANVTLWNVLGIQITFTGENIKTVTVPENSSSSASALGEFQFTGARFTINPGTHDGYTMTACTVTAEGSQQSVSMAGGIATVTLSAANTGVMSATITMKNNSTNQSYTYTVSSLSYRNHVYVNNLTTNTYNWYGGTANELTLTWTYAPQNNNATTTTTVQLSSNLSQYMTLKTKTPADTPLVDQNITAGSATYTVTNPATSRVAGTYTVNVVTNGQTYTSTGNIVLWADTGIYARFTGEVVTEYTGIKVADNNLSTKPYVEYLSGSPFVFRFGGFDPQYWSVYSGTVASGTGITSLTPVSGAQGANYKDFNMTFGSTGTSSINVSLYNAQTGEYLVYRLNNFRVRQNIYINSISFEESSYTHDKTGQFTVNYSYGPANYNVQPVQFTASISGTAASYASVASVTNGRCVVNVHTAADNTVKNGVLTVNVTDEKNNVITNTVNFTLTNNITKVLFDGREGIIDKPMVPGTYYNIAISVLPADTTQTSWSIIGLTGLDSRFSQISGPDNHTLRFMVDPGISDETLTDDAVLTLNGSAVSSVPVNITAHIVSGGYIEVSGNFWASPDAYPQVTLINKPYKDDNKHDGDSISMSYLGHTQTYKGESETRPGGSFQDIVGFATGSDDYRSSATQNGTGISASFTVHGTEEEGPDYEHDEDDYIFKRDLYMYRGTAGTDDADTYFNYDFTSDGYTMRISLAYPDCVNDYQFGYPDRTTVQTREWVEKYYNGTRWISEGSNSWNQQVYNEYYSGVKTVKFVNCVIDKPIKFYAAPESIKFINCIINCSSPVILNVRNDNEEGYEYNRAKNVAIDYTNCTFTVSDFDDTNMRTPIFFTYVYNEQAEDYDYTQIITNMVDVNVSIKYGDVDITSAAYNVLNQETSVSELPTGCIIKYGAGTTAHAVEYLRKQWGSNAAYMVKNENQETPLWIEVTGVGSGNTIAPNTINKLTPNIWFNINSDDFNTATKLTTSNLKITTANTGDKIYFWADMNDATWNDSAGSWTKIITLNSSFSSGTNNIVDGFKVDKIGGNILSLYYKDKFADYNDVTKTSPNNYKTVNFYNILVDDSIHKYWLLDASKFYICQNMPYSSFFSGCEKLQAAPDFSHITSVNTNQFSSMFNGCKALVDCPDLSNITFVGRNGLKNMFNGCSSLTYANLPKNITTAYAQGLENMFANCTSLTGTSHMKIGFVGGCGCSRMFMKCTSLTDALIEIDEPDTTLSAVYRSDAWMPSIKTSNYKYDDSTGFVVEQGGNRSNWSDGQYNFRFREMFLNCISLINFPYPIKTRGNDIYGMFANTPVEELHFVFRSKLNSDIATCSPFYHSGIKRCYIEEEGIIQYTTSPNTQRAEFFHDCPYLDYLYAPDITRHGILIVGGTYKEDATMVITNKDNITNYNIPSTWTIEYALN